MIDLYGYEEMTPHKEVLKQWGPMFWTQFREMMANYEFAGWTLDLLAYVLYRKTNNLFISTADENTIKQYEDMFRVAPSEEQTLEERRAIILLRFIGNQKISFSSIKSYIKEATGADCDVSWEGDTDTTIRIRIYRDGNPINNHNALYDTIRHKLPAQLGYDLQYATKTGVTLKVRRSHWKHIFDQTGTLPITNVGLRLNDVDIEVNNTGRGYRANRLMAGDTAWSTGEFPKTNIGYQESDGDFRMGVTSHGWIIPFQMCGDETL